MRKRIALVTLVVVLIIVGSCMWLLSSPWLTFALMHTDGETTVVATANISDFSDLIPQSLHANVFIGGWYQRMTFAAQHDNLWRTLAPAVRLLSEQRHTLQPDLLVSVAAQPTLLEEETLIVGNLEGATLTLYTVTTPQATTVVRNHELLFSIPSAAVTALPLDIRTRWNALLLQQLTFEHTVPDIMSTLAEAESFYVSRNGTGTIVSAQGSQKTIVNTFASWLTEEARFLNPQEQAFRLPDGTVGFEVVPGSAPTDRLPDPGTCRDPDPAPAPQLWLCNWNDGVSLSTERLSGQPARPTEEWVLHVSPSLYEAALEQQQLCAFPSQPYEHIVCSLTGFTVTGSSHEFVATLLLQ